MTHARIELPQATVRVFISCGILFLLPIILGTQLSLAQEPSNDDTPKSTAKANKQNASSNSDTEDESRSTDAWKWILGIVFTAIISPILVKLVEKHIGRDPIKDKSQRLQTVVDLQAARKAQGLPPDGRLTTLVNELTDALGDEAKGKEQAIDEATSFIVATLSSRLLESLFSSCRYIEQLIDSKHNSNSLLAIYDLTRLEFLRSHYGHRRMGIPSHFTSVSESDLTQYAQECERVGDELGKNAIRFAGELGTTPDGVKTFVDQLKGEIQKATERDAEERDESSSSAL